MALVPGTGKNNNKTTTTKTIPETGIDPRVRPNRKLVLINPQVEKMSQIPGRGTETKASHGKKTKKFQRG